MVDLENKIVYFGYGDVAVGSSIAGYMTFSSIKPPKEIGSDVDENNIISEPLKVVEDKTWELLELFKTVSIENRIVKYKDVTFDFTNYIEGSVNVCKKHAYKTVCLLALAC